MRCKTAIATLVLATLAAGTVYAVTKTSVPDFDHPYVGLVVYYDANGEFLWRCSGALVSPTMLLTAGHCSDTAGGARSARVYFEQSAGLHYDPAAELDPVTGYPDFCKQPAVCRTASTPDQIYNFDYTGALPDPRDVGIVILDTPYDLPQYGELPAAGQLDSLARARGTRDTMFTVSGYGVSYQTEEHSAVSAVSLRERLEATSVLVNLGSHLTDGYNLQTQGNGRALGGTCGGDSGGPIFLGDAKSNLIVGVTSFGLNDLCRGVDFYYRIDRQPVLDFINGSTP